MFERAYRLPQILIEFVNISSQHANFIINFGGASFEGVIALINLAQSRVFEEFGIELETEVVVL